MNNDQPKNVAVVLTEDLAQRSLAAANDAGMSRSAWVRQLIRAALGAGDTNDE